MFEALVLAGGRGTADLGISGGPANKAFVEVHGRPILAYILEALAQAPSLDRTIVVGPAGELAALQKAGHNFEIVPEEGTMLENLARAVQTLHGTGLFFVVTGDIPLLNAAVIEQFLALCAPFDGDFYYPVIKREAFLASFPETERTYVALKDGRLTGGNVSLVRADWYLENRARLEYFYQCRKKPLKLLRLLPPGFFLRYLTGRLSVQDLENALSRLLDFRARAVPCSLVELGIDVDKKNDLDLVTRILSSP